MDGWTGMKRIPKYIMRRQLTIFNPLWSLTYPLVFGEMKKYF